MDADGCPVKQEVYRLAKRYELKVVLVSNSLLRLPAGDRVRQVIVGGNIDAADDWIAEHVTGDDIVVSGDIVLASRCLAKGAVVIDPRGGVFTEDSIGEALAMQGLLSHLRGTGTITGGPRSFEKRDRSLFLQRLDGVVQSVRRRE